jgi:hypothetical protein
MHNGDNRIVGGFYATHTSDVAPSVCTSDVGLDATAKRLHLVIPLDYHYRVHVLACSRPDSTTTNSNEDSGNA